MEAEDPGASGVAEDGEGQASAGSPGSQQGSGGGGEAGAVAREAPQAAQALDAPVGGADAEPGPMARLPRRVPLQFILLVPFRSSVEAEIAQNLLAPRPQPGAVHQEVTLSGTVLTIRLTAEDIDQLGLSISSCLHELFLLIQNMWHTMPPFVFINHNTGNGG